MLEKLTREQVIQKIQCKPKDESLDLSMYDLSDVDLSNMNTDELNLRGAKFGTGWYTPHKTKACLKGARLEKSDLQGADFINVDLSGISFFASNLEYAKLGVTNCTNTSFSRAKMKGVNFYGARLDNTDFTDCDLRDTDFHSTYVGSIDLTNANVGKNLIFENRDKYYNFLKTHKLEERDLNQPVFLRLGLARKSYSVLKRVFLNNGQYEEASWAYFREKMTERKTFSPFNAYKYYADHLLKYRITNDSIERLMSVKFPEEIVDKLKPLIVEKAKDKTRFLQDVEKAIGQKETKEYDFDMLFYTKYPRNGYEIYSIRWQIFFLKYIIKWMFALFAEISCGYGEKPLRASFVAIFLIILFTFLYQVTGGVISTQSTMTFLDYFNYSLGAFTTIGFSNFQVNTPLAQTLTSLEALSGISILALLMFSLGKRISR